MATKQKVPVGQHRGLLDYDSCRHAIAPMLVSPPSRLTIESLVGFSHVHSASGGCYRIVVAGTEVSDAGHVRAVTNTKAPRHFYCSYDRPARNW